MWHGILQPPFWLALLGFGTAWFLYLKRPDIPATIATRLAPIHKVLLDKYGFDRFNDWFFAAGSRKIGTGLWQKGEITIIDGIVNGSAKIVDSISGTIRNIQTGYLYHYAFSMIIGLVVLLGWFVIRR
jgi:NADH-quinone oxidoreductase subunit L